MVYVGKHGCYIGRLFRRHWCSNRPPKSQWRSQEPSLIGTSLSSGTCGRSMFHQRLHLAEICVAEFMALWVVWHTFWGWNTLQRTNKYTNLGKRNNIFKSALGWDMLVPGSVVELLRIQVCRSPFAFAITFIFEKKRLKGLVINFSNIQYQKLGEDVHQSISI